MRMEARESWHSGLNTKKLYRVSSTFFSRYVNGVSDSDRLRGNAVAALHQGEPGQNDLAGRSTALAPPCLALRIALLR